jgi:molybdopterin synthase sulfur carrier subunit
MIKLLFFAQLAELAEKEALNVEFEPGTTIRGLLDLMSETETDQLIESLRHDVVMVSVNQIIADWDQVLEDGDEVAFLPPFSGG